MRMRLSLAVASLLLGTACGGSTTVASSGTWTELPTPPVSPRTGSTTAWTGTEALFLGGVDGDLCPPSASCTRADPTARDGAAWNPATGTWRKTAPAPVDIPGFTSASVLGDRVYLLVDHGLLVYDASDDAWHTEKGPRPADGWWHLTEAGDGLLAVRGSHEQGYHPDLRYDVDARSWTPLPRDPYAPMFDRELVWTPYGIVLTGRTDLDSPGTHLETSLARGALLDPSSGVWRRLPTSDQLAGVGHWTGRRLVNPALTGGDGGEVNGFGRWVPYGGVLELPAGTWRHLPDAPEPLSGGWGVDAADGPLLAGSGYVYDDRDESWSRVPRPAKGPERSGAAVWADGVLIELGGLTDTQDYSARSLTNRAYAYEP
jgi:hypothetical protein